MHRAADCLSRGMCCYGDGIRHSYLGEDGRDGLHMHATMLLKSFCRSHGEQLALLADQPCGRRQIAKATLGSQRASSTRLMLRPAPSRTALPLKRQSHPQLPLTEVPRLPQASFNRAFVSRETSPLALPPAMPASEKLLWDASSREDDSNLSFDATRGLIYVRPASILIGSELSASHLWAHCIHRVGLLERRVVAAMYNGIGILTPRGTGTSGYVQDQQIQSAGATAEEA